MLHNYAFKFGDAISQSAYRYIAWCKTVKASKYRMPSENRKKRKFGRNILIRSHIYITAPAFYLLHALFITVMYDELSMA